MLDIDKKTDGHEIESPSAYFGMPALRDVAFDESSRREGELDRTVAKRARHVITENARTETAAEALAQGNLQQMGRLMAESHVSMRDDFEITVPAIDSLVEIMDAVIGNAGGARMTGGGFGGCVVALARQEMVPEIKATIAKHYPAASGLEATVYVCQASAEAGLL